MSEPSVSDLIQLLAPAWRNKRAVAVPQELAPPDMDAAYAVQEGMLDAIGKQAGGWKIGARSPDVAAQGAPLPAGGIHRDGAVLRRADFPVLGLELEIAFSLSYEFRDEAEAEDAAVLQAIDTMRVSVELVSSRVEGWPDVKPLIQLGDLQNHGALVIGEATAYDPAFDFLAPTVRFAAGDKVLFQSKGSNPAGDPRQLLPWVVRHCLRRSLPLPPGSVLTTGTYVGAHFEFGAGIVCGEIDGLPTLRFTIE